MLASMKFHIQAKNKLEMRKLQTVDLYKSSCANKK